MGIIKILDDIKQFNAVQYSESYAYQIELTKKLDKKRGDFSQEDINEIVLWKVNRYARIEEDCLVHLNKISATAKKLDKNQTREVLLRLLDIKGVQIPMASTILRFRNPAIYQIIDQRAFRVLYGKDLKVNVKKEKQIDLYLDYLEKLREKCGEYNIPFKKADRILYMADKKVNKTVKLNT